MPTVTNNLLGQYVEEVKKIYGERLKSVILYGSYARGDFMPANILLREGEYRGANNRTYYAVYHAISAVHALDGKSGAAYHKEIVLV